MTFAIGVNNFAIGGVSDAIGANTFGIGGVSGAIGHVTFGIGGVNFGKYVVSDGKCRMTGGVF